MRLINSIFLFITSAILLSQLKVELDYFLQVDKTSQKPNVAYMP
jgi:hypothetical protein